METYVTSATSGVFPILKSTKYLNFCVERERETSSPLHMLFGSCFFGCKEHLSVFRENELSCRHLGHREKKHCLSSFLSGWSCGMSEAFPLTLFCPLAL